MRLFLRALTWALSSSIVVAAGTLCLLCAPIAPAQGERANPVCNPTAPWRGESTTGTARLDRWRTVERGYSSGWENGYKLGYNPERAMGSAHVSAGQRPNLYAMRDLNPQPAD